MHLKMRRQRKLNYRTSCPSFESVWITHICLMVRHCLFLPHYSLVMFLWPNHTKILQNNWIYFLCLLCLFSISLYWC
uniref:Macaca fascicularis brain cDNA clone: QflA-16760, similar to human chromodomain helicase DNA binding protein 1-like(CHD1L), mRNA, RefSeq: NM_004284.2 n=1 Tax=Macaca fascicularis TaxID=9541 RepID=I7GL30_MACFA|nr:unnamed protein product [Macaca fascicularis]